MTWLDLAILALALVIALPPRYDPAIRLKQWIDE
jgi:hypothetical protein